MEAVGDASLGGEVDHLVHHIARAGHDEAHVVAVAKHLCRCLYEVFGAFLHGNTAEECYHFFFCGTRHLDVEKILAQGHYGVVNRGHLGRVDAVVVDYCPAG